MKIQEEKKHDINEMLRQSKQSLIAVLMVLVTVRMYMLFFVTENLSLVSYVHLGVNTLAWFAVAYFMCNCSMLMHPLSFPKNSIIEMKKIAFWAMIICVMRIIVSAFYYWPVVTRLLWPTIHNIIEIVAWALLACFFGCYWRIRVRQDKDGLLDDSREW